MGVKLRDNRGELALSVRELRVGIIGCGKIADGHAEVVQYLPGATLAAACDREILLAEQLATRFNVPAFYADADEMLARESLDVVHITTPPAAHLPLTRQCVSAGANVFLEKPLALNASDAADLVHTATVHDRLLSINYWPNFDPPAMQFKQMMNAGTIGAPVHLEAFIGYDLAGPYGQALMSDSAHWVHRLPGKLFQNMMDHIFNRILPLMPPDPSIRALAYKRRTSVREDASDAMLDELRVTLLANGVSAFGSLCSHARPVANTLKVYGTKATVEVDFNNRTVILAGSQRYPSALGRLFPPFQLAGRYLKQGTENLRLFRRHQFHYFRGMTTLLGLFYESIRSGAPLPISYAEIMATARVMDEVIAQVYPAGGAQ